MGALRSPEASPQNVLYPPPSWALPEGRASTQHPKQPQPSPIFGGKRGPVPLRPATRGEAERRTCIPGEAPGDSGREFPAGRRGHPRWLLHRHGVPPRHQCSRGQGRGLHAGAERPHGQGPAALGGPRAGAQPGAPGARGRAGGTSCKHSPPLGRVSLAPARGRPGSEVCCWVLHQAPSPHGGTCAEVSFARSQGQPLLLQTRSQPPRVGGSQGSAFFRYGGDKAAPAGDFPRQFGLNFKPLLLSLSGATLGSQGREQRPGSCPLASSPCVPRNPPRPPCHDPRHTTPSRGDKRGSDPGEMETPGLLAAATGTSLFLAWAALQLNEAQLTPSEFGHLCHGGDGGDHPHPARASGFHLEAGTCLL